MNFIDYYELLGINKDADRGDIIQAYWEKSREYNEKSITTEEEDSEMVKCDIAKYILLDPERRKRYDAVYEEFKNKTQKNNTENGFIKWYHNFGKEYKKVRVEEKRSSFRDRHESLSNEIYEEYPDANKLERILSHIDEEIAYRFPTGANINNLIIRNRKAILALLLSGVMLFSIGASGSSKKKDTSAETSISAEKDTNQGAISLVRYYTIKPGDTLWNIAIETGKTVRELAAYNDIDDINQIRSNTTIAIPYKVSKEDLEYCTQSIDITNIKPDVIDYSRLVAIAQIYHTDLDTLVSLNQESIEVEDSDALINTSYTILSNSLCVPTFGTTLNLDSTIKTAKEKTPSKTYVKEQG